MIVCAASAALAGMYASYSAGDGENAGSETIATKYDAGWVSLKITVSGSVGSAETPASGVEFW